MTRKFIYSEAALAEVTGISRSVLKRLRLEMPKGKYWRKSKKGKGGLIELSEEAVQIVLKTFGITDTDLTGARLHFGKTAKRTIDPKQETLNGEHCIETVSYPAPAPSGFVVLPDPPKLKQLTVTFIPVNVRILHARNGSEEYKVIVPSNKVWAVGNPLRAKPSVKNVGFMELASAAPRWRGDRMFMFNEGFV